MKWTLYRQATGIIVQTELAKTINEKFLGHPNIVVIGNPVKKIDGKALVAKEKIILNVGRFSSLKNQKFLIDAYHAIGDRTWKLVFVGTGPYLAEVKYRAIQLGVAENVEFLAEVEDIDTQYRRASIFAFASLSEGFPNSLAEALNTPVASIAFDCLSGPSELIEHNVNGFLIPVESKGQYIACLKRLMDDQELRAEFEVQSASMMKRFQSALICEQYFRCLSDNLQ